MFKIQIILFGLIKGFCCKFIRDSGLDNEILRLLEPMGLQGNYTCKLSLRNDGTSVSFSQGCNFIQE